MKFLQIIMMLLMLGIILGGNFYVFYRLWNIIPSGIIRILVVIIGIASILSLFLSLLGNSFLPSPVVSVLYRVSTSWFFIFLYLLIIFLIADLIRVTHLIPIERYMYSSWTGFIVLASFITIVMTLGFVKYNNKKRVELTINIDKNTGYGRPFKIVAISDLHLGFAIGNRELGKWVDKINAEDPDIILIAGDVTDNNIHPLYEQDMAESFRKLKSKYGVYAILGNHEYMAGIPNVRNFYNEANVVLLIDSVALVNDMVYIAGRDDMTNPDRKSIEDLILNIDKSKPIILLDHQPHNLNEATENNIDIQFSGHTHHGQLIPISWITNIIFEKSHGYLKKNNTNIYVSSGLGIWGGKFRIGTQSEYVIINMETR